MTPKHLIIVLALCLLIVPLQPLNAASQTGNWGILFAADTGDTHQIFFSPYHVATELSPVTPEDSNAYSASATPDGTAVVVATDEGLVEYYADGTDPTLMYELNASTGTEVALPRYSPDGNAVVFTKLYREADAILRTEICTIDRGGENEMCLDEDKDNLNWEPAWSPDGSQIVFVSDRGGNENLWVMSAEGTNLKQLTSSSANKYSPDWSPDGTKIAFAMENEDETTLIYTLTVKTKKVSRLSAVGRNDTDPVWSPDGKLIAFSSYVSEGISEIFVMKANGSMVEQVTNLEAESRYPAWVIVASE